MAYIYMHTGIAFVHVHPYRNEPHINVKMSMPMCSWACESRNVGLYMRVYLYACPYVCGLCDTVHM